MKITIKEKQTNHPNVPNWFGYVLIDDVVIGQGDLKDCKLLADELKLYLDEAIKIKQSALEDKLKFTLV